MPSDETLAGILITGKKSYSYIEIFGKCTKMVQLSRAGGKTSIFMLKVDIFYLYFMKWYHFFSVFSRKNLIRIITKFLLVKIWVFQSLILNSLHGPVAQMTVRVYKYIFTPGIVRCLILQKTWLETDFMKLLK